MTYLCHSLHQVDIILLLMHSPHYELISSRLILHPDRMVLYLFHDNKALYSTLFYSILFYSILTLSFTSSQISQPIIIFIMMIIKKQKLFLSHSLILDQQKAQCNFTPGDKPAASSSLRTLFGTCVCNLCRCVPAAAEFAPPPDSALPRPGSLTGRPTSSQTSAPTALFLLPPSQSAPLVKSPCRKSHVQVP